MEAFAHRFLSWHGLRRLFYLVTPEEELYMTMEDVPDIYDSVMGWFAVFMLLEMLYVGCRDGFRSFSSHRLDDIVTSVCAGLFQTLLKGVSAAIAIQVYTYIYVNYRFIDLPLTAYVWLLCFVTTDIAYYFGHRATHEIGFLWSFHQMHHSSEYYILPTALRQGCLQYFAMATYEMPQALFIPPPIWIVHRYLNNLYQFWIHTEVVGTLGPFEYVLSTPSHHRVHHGRNPYCIDKNYGGTLIIWDRLFGTFAKERPDEKIAYGLVTNVNSFNQLWLQFHEFAYFLYEKPSSMRSWWNKIQAVFMPPGWQPGSKTVWFGWWRMADTEDGIPEVDHSIERHTNLHRMGVVRQMYCAVHFILICAHSALITNPNTTLSPTHIFIHTLHCIWSMQSMGAFFDVKQSAPIWEIMRLFVRVIFIDQLTGDDPQRGAQFYTAIASIPLNFAFIIESF